MELVETIRDILEGEQKSAAVGVITQIELNQARSALRCLVSVWPDEIEVVATMTWDAIAPDAGIFMFPAVNDLVLLNFSEDDEEQVFIIRRLSSGEDTIPKIAEDGSLVLKAKSGTKSWLSSDTRINLSKGETEPTENLVLGQKFKATYTSHLEKLVELIEKLVTQRQTDSVHTHLVIGIPSTGPNESAAMIAEKNLLSILKDEIDQLKTDDVVSEKILSDLAFTEKGD